MHLSQRLQCRPGKKTARLRFETLEDRTTPTTLTGLHGAGCGCGVCFLRVRPEGTDSPDLIYDRGTTDEYMNQNPDAILPESNPMFSQLTSKWSTTATNGAVTGREPVILTWGIVPDGLGLGAVQVTGEANNGPSTLRAFMDGLYGAGPGGADLTLRPWFPLFQNSLNRLAAVSGITYVYEPNDDSASFPGNAGVTGVRPDVRIGGRNMDGGSGVLAYNFFPNTGDMVIDTQGGGLIGNTSNGSRTFRNILMHEQGHGVGIEHEMPTDGTTLMEPFLNTSFDGPQFDDIFGLHRHYGDQFEKGSANAATGTATAIGNLTDGGSLVRGASATNATELTGTTATDFVSIDDETDVDVYSFSVAGNLLMTATVTPVGPTYLSGAQGGPSPTSFNASTRSDLTLEFLDSAGTVIGTSNVGGLGVAESVTGIYSGLSGGSFFVRVTGATANRVQLYRLNLTAVPGGSTVAVVGSDLQAIGTSGDDGFTVVRSGTNYRVTNPSGAIAGAGATQINATTVDVPIASVPGIIDVRGNGGTDTLTLNLSGGNITPAGGILYSGGAGTDTVVSPDVSGAWSITSAGGGTLTVPGASLITFTGMESLTGSSQADSFTFGGGSVTGAINGGAGTDVINADNGGRTFTISAANGGSINIISAATFSNIENLIGGSGTDSFNFSGAGALTGNVDGGGGNDSLQTGSVGYTVTVNLPNTGTIPTLLNGFGSIETVTGGAGADTLVLQAGGSLAGTFNGNGGNDTLDLSAFTSQTVTLTALGATDGFNGTASLAPIPGFQNLNSIIGTPNSDTLTGRDLAAAWTLTSNGGGTYVESGRTLAFTSFQTLNGGSAADVFNFSAGGRMDSLNGGGGNDTILGDDTGPRNTAILGLNSGFVSTNVPVGFSSIENLQGGNSTLNDAFYFFDGGSLSGTINGGSGGDAIFGPNDGLVYTLTGLDAGTISSVLGGGFTSIEFLHSGSGDDTFIFQAAGARLSANGDGGDGTDTFIGADDGRTYVFDSFDLGTFSYSTLPFVTGMSSFENIVAGSGSDTLQFKNGGIVGTIDSGAGADLFQVSVGSSTGTLVSGIGDDTFELNSGSFSGSISAGADNDTIKLAGTDYAGTADGGSGVNSFQVSGGISTATLVGGTGIDSFAFTGGTLNGPISGNAGADTFTFTAGTLNGSADGGDDPDSFTLNGGNVIGNMVGGAGAETFLFSSGTLDGTADGGTEADTFTLNGATLTSTLVGGAGADIFNVNAGSATGIDAGSENDTFNFGGGAINGTVDGGTGNDFLQGDNAGRTFNITAANTGSIPGMATTFLSVETVQGGAGADLFAFSGAGSLAGALNAGLGSDSISGNDSGLTFAITGTNAGGVSVVPAGFTSIENVAGGAGADAFTFNGAGVLNGAIDGKGGSDSIQGDNFTRTYTVSGANSGTISVIVPAGFSNVENLLAGTGGDLFNFTGGSLSGIANGGGSIDTLTSDNAGRTFTLGSAGGGSISGLALFSNMENLNAGSGGDTLVLQTGGSLSGTFDAKGGADSVDFSQLTVAQSLALTNVDANGFTATVAGVGTTKGIDALIGTSKTTDAVAGLATTSLWQTKAGANQTFYRKTSSGQTLYLTGFEVFTGNSAIDTFQVDFTAGIPLTTAGLTVDGAGGSDAITLIGTANADSISVVVGTAVMNGRVVRHSNVEKLSIYAGNGADQFTVGTGLPSALSLVELFGEAGNDYAKVKPSTTARIKFDGGAGTDKLRVDVTQSGMPLFVPPPGIVNGTYLFNTYQPIDFLSVELREFGPVP